MTCRAVRIVRAAAAEGMERNVKTIEERQKLTLARLQQHIDELPLLPAVAIDLVTLDAGREDYFECVLQHLRGDPGFAARVLRYANSASTAPTQPVCSLESALLHIGARRAVSLVVTGAATGILTPRGGPAASLWRHSMDVACLMETLAQHVIYTRVNSHKAYLFGLLHDIGCFIMHVEAPAWLRAVEDSHWHTPEELITEEKAICGFDHAELGYRALLKWQMPLEIAHAVRHHHALPAPGHDLPNHELLLIQMLQDADWISIALAQNSTAWRRISWSNLRAILLPTRLHFRINVSADAFVRLVRDALERSAQLQSDMGLPPDVPEGQVPTVLATCA